MSATLASPNIQHLIEYGQCPAYPAPSDSPRCQAARETQSYNTCDGFHWKCSCGVSGDANGSMEQAEAQSLEHVPHCEPPYHTVDCFTGVRQFSECDMA